MKIWKRFIFALSGLLVSSMLFHAPILADDYIDDDLQNWDMITLTTPIHGKVKLYLEAQQRFGSDLTQTDRLLLRPAIGYQLTPKLSLWQGYAWTPTVHPTYNDEHRLFQQVQYVTPMKKFTLTSRTRMEERFIENAKDPAYRVREMIRLSRPIGKTKNYVVGYDEVFFNLNTVPNPSGPAAGFDQNRLFLGVGRDLTSKVKLEGGYINNYVNRVGSGVVDRMNHIILLSLNINL